MDILQIAWARYTGAFVLTLFVSNPITQPALLRSGNLKLQIVRAVLLVASTVLNFTALRYMQLDEVLSIIFTFPFVVAIASGPLLGEWIGWRRWLAILVGFSGVLLVTRPGGGGIHPAALLSFGSALCYALYVIATRVLSRYDTTETTLFYSNLVGAVAMLPILFFVWTPPQSWFIVLLMIVVGAFGSLGHFLLIAGHRLAPASVLAPFIYTQIIWTSALGFIVFGDVPNQWTIAGSAIVIASGLYLLNRERKVGARKS
jgi:drug/metabolite transporter (DMT)-like permease